MPSTLIILVILGLCAGSFVNALVWRLHKDKDWVKARSQCPSCGHVLAAKDLIPVLSWLLLRGKCRYCNKPISAQYPLVEAVMAIIFLASYIYWPQQLSSSGQIVLFVSWLGTSVGLLALLVYDRRWMLLPNKLIYPTFLIAAAGNTLFLLGFSNDRKGFLLSWVVSVLIASGVFWLLFIVSSGKWIGYGDVRLGLITGTVLHSPIKSLLMIFLASVLGSLFVLPFLATGKTHLSTKVPYGPFLIISTALCLLFGPGIIDWYSRLLLPQ